VPRPQPTSIAWPLTGSHPYLKPPTVLWDMLDEAVITIQCEAHDPVAAAETVSSIIRRNAEYVAQIGVREIEVIEVSHCG
jgi:hypothetical protein